MQRETEESELATTVATCAIALLIEAAVGYPAPLFDAIGHPVSWMGALLARLDATWNREKDPADQRRARGATALAVLLLVCGLASVAATSLAFQLLPNALAVAGLALLASTCLAQRSLDAHVRTVARTLEDKGLPAARTAVGQIVGRDTSTLDAAGVARAAIESLAENFADGVVAPAFWLALLGLPGAMLYKAVNTADSMIGHRTPRHLAFGFAAAKVDDVMNFVPARLAALWLVLAAAFVPAASASGAWRIMRRDASGHPSPNAGWPEAAMAGALGIRLGGPRSYHGCTVADASIGDGEGPTNAATIRAALWLYRVACAIEILVAAGFALLIAR